LLKDCRKNADNSGKRSIREQLCSCRVTALAARYINPCNEDLIPIELRCADVLRVSGCVWLSERNLARDFYAHAIW